MSDHQSNSLSGIDKYSGSFDQDELGVTMIPTITINLLTNFVMLGLFTYLASRPADWKLNAKHLAAHFDCNKEKIYNAIDGLISLGLLTRTQVRNNGKFARYHYRLHLRQKVHSLPNPEKPDTVKPDTEKPDTYKTNILPLENKDNKKLTTIEPPPSSSCFFSKTTDKNLLNQKLLSDKRTDEEFLRDCEIHVNTNSDQSLPRLQRANALIKLLKQLNFDKIIFTVKKPEQINKPETHEERMVRYQREREANFRRRD